MRKIKVKVMKRLSRLLIMSLLIGVLFGCSLASKEPENHDKTPVGEVLEEVLRGYWLTFDVVELDDFTLEQDLILMEHPIKVGVEDVIDYVNTDGIFNFGLQLKTHTYDQPNEGVLTLKSTILKADVHLLYDEEVTFFAYPVYWNKTKKSHTLGNPTIYTLQVDKTELTISMSQSQTLNQIKQEFGVSISVSLVDSLEYVEIIEFNSSHEVLKTTQITEDETIDYSVSEDTSYIMIKEVYQGKDGEYVKRTLLNRNDTQPVRNFLLNFTNSKGFVIGNRINLKWGQVQ